ncbi:MAG: tetratricopeptide repeat protein [Flavobacteriaceae bacterium]
MKKTFFLLTLFFTSLMGISQEAELGIKEASEATCNCISEMDDTAEESLEEQLQNCFMVGSLLYQLKGIADTIATESQTDSTQTKNYNIEIGGNLPVALQDYLAENCESFKSLSLSPSPGFSNELVQKVTEESCGCIENISTALVLFEKNEKIQDCIVKALVAEDSKNEILSQVEAAQAFYKEVQFQLTAHCEAMENLYFASDSPKANAYSDNPKAIEFYNKGIRADQEDDLKEAIKNYQKAVKIDKDFLFAWDNLGLALRKMDKLEESIEAYKESLRIDPVHSMALMNIGVAYNYIQDFDNAIKYYKILVENYPEDPEGPYGISLVYRNKGDIEQSLRYIFDAYRLYEQAKSPYLADAQRIIESLYADFEDENKVDTFKKIAKEKGMNLKFNN